ncbi:peroxiredoxin [Parabacteroides sp. PFB2-12]|uniref:TlpA family protein disulfide reductase n=1 Tax=unclassified Parabacteroides TaxID=2649774 RepID=UPI00247529AF|nr:MULTISPECIES: TlpA disulfide reductase family protein [unclassified Parabacteroides]MDH6343665.1 peroxiredoxin [Parabacteroides sp. PM6-13]MDH6391301.1 peroxiredoxin [Parabacteroides sp. PFB2-12]
MRLTKSVFVFWALCLVCSLSSCIKEHNEDSDDVVSYVFVGDRVPSFSVEDNKGNRFHADDFKGKRSLLTLFNTTCSDCKRELEIIESVWQKLKNDPDYQVIAIGRQETMESIDACWNERHLTIPAFPDPKREIFTLFAGNYIPRIYLIDTTGTVRWMAIENLESTTAEDLVDRLKKLP